jgi:hypothetical protein
MPVNKQIVKRLGVKNGENTEGVQNPQTLDYQTDNQAFWR